MASTACAFNATRILFSLVCEIVHRWEHSEKGMVLGAAFGTDISRKGDYLLDVRVGGYLAWKATV